MERGLKERLVGAAVLVILAVIFIPIILDSQQQSDLEIKGSNIPPVPENMPSISDEAGYARQLTTGKEDAEERTDKLQVTAGKEDTPRKEETETAEKQTAEQADAAGKEGDGTLKDKAGVSAWVVQVGSFSNQENADDLNNDLRKAGFRSFIEPLGKSGKISYRVRIGPELKRSDAETIRDKVKKEFKLDGILLRYP